MLTLRGGCRVYGKAGVAKASGPGCTALYGVGVGVPSPEPVLFSLRQSSGLLRPLGQSPWEGRHGGEQAGRLEETGEGQCDPGVPLASSACPHQPVCHSLAAAGVERVPQRGAAFVQACVCLRGGWMPVYRCLRAPRAQLLPGVSGSADDVSIWGPRVACGSCLLDSPQPWALNSHHQLACAASHPTEMWGRGRGEAGHRHCCGRCGGEPAPRSPLSLLPYLFIYGFLPSFTHSLIPELGAEHGLWARHGAGLWETRGK